ncbi:MAG: glutamate-5-semialdehyde dehydrogenase, partial [Luminiphilus sp.]|nr:glutamate-5-semialdehyde dehydrogenase [Luminiphilus sp.]
MTVTEHVSRMAQSAKRVAPELAASTVQQRNAALDAIGETIELCRAALLEANQRDIATATTSGLEASLVDRLTLNDDRINAMLEGLRVVRGLPDPIGGIEGMQTMDSGIQVGQMRVPLGLIGIIYESRPNVTIDAASLCLKSGNAVLLRGGSEAQHSNQLLAECIATGLEKAGLNPDLVAVIDTTDRAAVSAMVQQKGVIDMVIPRGGKGLIERVSAEALVPVLKHLDGVCHLYIHKEADRAMAVKLAVNAKTHRYGTCNTVESILVDAQAEDCLADVIEALQSEGVEVRGCERVLSANIAGCVAASEDDWYEEYLAPIVSIRVVDDIEAAIAHISQYGSAHTDAIVTNCHSSA